MSSPNPPTPTPAPTPIVVTGTTSTPHWMTLLAAIMAAINATLPIVIHVIPPAVGEGIEVGAALEPVVISTIQTVTGK